MPIYEYQCKNCGKSFERMQKISEPPRSTCPECGKQAKRIISQTSFSLKGGGWYKDGYAGHGSTGTSKGKSEKKNSSTKKD